MGARYALQTAVSATTFRGLSYSVGIFGAKASMLVYHHQRIPVFGPFVQRLRKIATERGIVSNLEESFWRLIGFLFSDGLSPQ